MKVGIDGNPSNQLFLVNTKPLKFMECESMLNYIR